MKRKFLLTLLMVSVVFSAPLWVPSKMVLVGKGIAANPEDVYDFHIIKAVYGKIFVYNKTLDDFFERRIGGIKIDNKLYKLTEVVSGNGSFYAKIVPFRSNETVGEISLEYIEKGHAGVWVGTLTINGSTYNTYIMAIPYRIAPIVQNLPPKVKMKIKNKLKTLMKIEYCINNPDNPQCSNYLQECVNSDTMICKEFMRRFCLRHPEHTYCLEYKNKYSKGPGYGLGNQTKGNMTG